MPYFNEFIIYQVIFQKWKTIHGTPENMWGAPAAEEVWESLS